MTYKFNIESKILFFYPGFQTMEEKGLEKKKTRKNSSFY